MKQLVVVVQAQQKRAENLLFAGVTKSADNTVCAPDIFDLNHRVPLPRGVGRIQSFGHDSVEIASHFIKPLLCHPEVDRGGREANSPFGLNIWSSKLFEKAAPFAQRM